MSNQVEINQEQMMNDQGSPQALKALMVGRPNAGKTSVYNRLTGHRLKTGNYHGVTVEHAEGVITVGDHELTLIDLPGTPSLIPHSPDEGLTVSAVMNGALGRYDFLITVVDAMRLLEGLYLSLQVIELGWPTLVIVNQLDLAKREGQALNLMALQDSLRGDHPDALIEVVGVSAVTGEGMETLNLALKRMAETCSKLPAPTETPTEERTIQPWVNVQDVVEESDPVLVDEVRALLNEVGQFSRSHLNVYLHWLSMSAHETEAPINAKIRLLATADLTLKSAQAESQINARYQWLDRESTAWLFSTEHSQDHTPPFSKKLDQWLLHPLWGSLVFIGFMIMMFQALFIGADPFIGLIEDGVAALGEMAQATLPASIVSEFIIEGLINGIGNVIVFLPQVLILFGLIGLMEDSGYMARAAALTDRVMRSAGLSGRAFVPMLSGFICAVPAILATRTLPQRRDRLLTMMALPLLTCSARLPVYTLLIATLLPNPGTTLGIDHRAWVMVLLYLFATFTAFAAVWVMGKTILKGEAPPLLLHLPDYRRPVAKDVLQRLSTRAMVFIKEAGSVIFVGTVVLWILLSFPRLDSSSLGVIDSKVSSSSEMGSKSNVQDQAEHRVVDPKAPQAHHLASQRAQSFGGQIGRFIEPVLRPLGWDWQIGVGLIGAFAAREVFVSTLGMVYGVGGEVDEESVSLRQRIRMAKHTDGTPVFTPTSALALLIFFSLACQCLSTLAAVKRETGGYRWPMFMFGYMSVLAYGCALLITWIGRYGFGLS